MKFNHKLCALVPNFSFKSVCKSVLESEKIVKFKDGFYGTKCSFYVTFSQQYISEVSYVQFIVTNSFDVQSQIRIFWIYNYNLR